MSDLLRTALAERKELLAKLAKVERVIELLGGELEKPRRHNAATRKKMKEAWARRKLEAQNDTKPSENVSIHIRSRRVRGGSRQEAVGAREEENLPPISETSDPQLGF